MVWSSDTLTVVDEAIERATAGIPTVLDVRGDGGFGKTRLINEIGRRFPVAQVLRGTAPHGSRTDPLSLLAQVGVDGRTAADPLTAARALGERIDDLPHDGPVAVLLDDLQWADRESIDAVGVLMARVAGDRLLLVAAHRPTGSGDARWRTHLDDLPSVRRIALAGLSEDEALQLIQETAPTASASLARDLRRHTGGSPLFLRSLLHEYPVDELAARSESDDLPAPLELVRAMRDRVARMPDSVGATLSALAVLGDQGADLFTLSAVSDVADVRPPLDVLTSDQLVVVEGRGPAARARIFHHIVRTALYDAVPPAVRDRMHTIAAVRLSSAAERLHHRVQAARGADEGLAADLDAFTESLHERTRYREAARFRRYAAQLSSSPDMRAQRNLDADFESLLASDFDHVRVDPDATASSAYARVIAGAELALRSRYVEAADTFAVLTESDFDSLTPLTAYRARILRAHAMSSAGRSPHAALSDLAAADASPVKDPAPVLQVIGEFAATSARARITPPGELLLMNQLIATPRAAIASTPQGPRVLAQRGAMLALCGYPAEAIRDFTLMISKLDAGVPDSSVGNTYTFHGFAYFMNGEWERAALTLDLAATARWGSFTPIIPAMLPLLAVMDGDGIRALEAMEVSRRALTIAPEPLAIQVGDIVDIVTIFFLGDDAQKTRWLAARTADLGRVEPWAEESVPYLWYVSMGIAAHWAGDSAAVGVWSNLIRRMRDQILWGANAADWLDARADPTPHGAERLAALASSGLDDVPVLDAMLKVDAAQRNPAAGDSLRGIALAALRAIGADHLAESLLPAGDSRSDSPAAEPRRSVMSRLSDRERDVATLLLEGLSYAQIARELYITRSTVAFHLSRIYAKTDTTSRHEFSELARVD